MNKDKNLVTNLYIKELDLATLQPNTKTYMKKDQGGSKHVVIGKPGCFAKGTEVLMYDGSIKKVEDIEINDKIMGDDSTVRTVLDLCHGYETMYNVTPNKGDTYKVNENHILSLKCTGYNSHKKGELLDISVKDFLTKSKTFQNRYKWYRAPVEFEHKKLDIDPYMIGYWLGDGTSSTSDITTADIEVVDYFQQNLPKINLHFNKNKSKYRYRIKQDKFSKKNHSFLNCLRKYNMINNKHIPLVYKTGSTEQRLELLAGLIDSDGSYDKNCHGYDFIQKNEKLFDDVLYLARSLGFSAYKKRCIKHCTNSPGHSGKYYRCFISGNISSIPCKIKRKLCITPKKIQKDVSVTGFKLTKLDEGNYYGFELDGNNRFIGHDFTVLHNTGKSTLISSLLYAKKHIYPCGIVFSGTEDSNGFYSKMFPNTFIFNKYDEEQLRSFIRRQKIAKKHLSNPWAVCLLDDCTDTPALFNKPLQQGIYKNSRHWKMWYILSLQYCMDVKPVIRTNVDGTFILREPNLKNRKSLYENYAGIIPDFSSFCDIMDQITDDYTALYIHNATKSNKLEDCLFWYKATPPPTFKFGAPYYWHFHDVRYNQDYVEPFLPP